MERQERMTTAPNTTQGHGVTGMGSSSTTAAPPTTGVQQQGTLGSTGTTPGASAGASLGQKVKDVATQGHGLGESLRGNMMDAVDSLSGDRAAQAKNENIIRKGEQEVRQGHVQSRQNPL